MISLLKNAFKTIIVISVISYLLINFPVSTAESENLLINPGFEDGSGLPLNWTFFSIDNNTPILSNISHSGSRSVQISIQGTADSKSGYPASDVIEVESDTTYTFTVWGKTENSNGTNPPALRLVELDANNNPLSQSDIIVFSRGTNDWEERTEEFYTGSNTAYFYIYASIFNGFGNFWLDDITVNLKDNIVANPGFESGISLPLNWTFLTVNNNTPTLSNISHTGLRSAEISVPGTTDGQSGYPASDVIRVKSNTTYTFTAWGKTENANGTNPPVVRIAELDDQMNLFNLIDLPFGRGSSDWEQRLIDFQTGSNTAYIYIYADIWKGYGTFLIDDISLGLKRESPVPSPAPNTTVPPDIPIPSPGPSPAPPAPSEVVIAFASDAETVGYPGESEEIKDLNAMLQLSPTGSLNAIVFAGDMSLLSDAKEAISKSNLKDVPYYFTVGNHEAESSNDISIIKSSLPAVYPLNPGPEGSEKTTYSFDIGNIHIAVINTYWDGETNEGYFKYGDDGGWIPPDLMAWIDTDLSKTEKPYKIVVFHDPLYPEKNHVGDSLDADKTNRDQLQSILEKNKVSLVVAGHTQYAYLNKYGSIWHANTGGFGTHMHGKYDGFASVVYAYDTGSELKIMWKHEDPTWSTPRSAIQTVYPAATLTPVPTPVTTLTPAPAPTPVTTPTPGQTVSPTPVPTTTPVQEGTTIAYLGDARPSKFGTKGITELTNDFNQVVPQSPTGKVDAIFMIGDMDKIPQTRQAYDASDVKNIPIYYVVGNHEVDTSGDVSTIRSLYSTSTIPLSPGPPGTEKTTYSMNIGGIHVINSNQYWDGNNNGKCDWYSSGANDVSDDACFKYSSSDGGYIPDALYDWMNSDLSSALSWKIVVGHEPLYPKSRHTGNSLDRDKTNRDKLQKLFIDQKVSIFVGAHTHYAGIENVEGVYHVNAGVSGQKTEDDEDQYASIIYTNTDPENNLILTWKREDPTWSRPRTLTYTIKK